MRRALATAAALLVVLATAVIGAPGAAADGIAGYSLTALAAGVRYQLNSPGLLPVGDTAEGNIIELDVPIARSLVSQGPLINALASPAYPGDTAAHLGTALSLLAPQLPAIPNDPVLAESNYPPTPLHGQSTSFSSNGVGEGSAKAGPEGTDVIAHSVAQSIGGVVTLVSATARNVVTIAGDKVHSTATAEVSRITISDLITIEGVTGVAEAVSDGNKATPTGRLNVGKVTVAGQAAFIDADGVHVVGGGAGQGVITGLQGLVNATLATDGVKIRTIAPVVTSDKGLATATSGALAITLERTVPAIAVPGVPALEIPGAAPVVLGTPDVPTHIEILIAEARVGANATSLLPFDVDLGAPLIGGDTVVSGDSFSGITGAGSSVQSALNPPAQRGQGELGFAPSAERIAQAVPFGFVILCIFGALVASGSLLGYARWQLLEGRHR
ncbi:MAG TPA: hypothetical protein VFB78_10370 [Acidimicrobiales bacterium]|nr:hypothetical protein [Acidimicrobiales bacterium]